jgi:copper(I)-binding protein
MKLMNRRTMRPAALTVLAVPMLAGCATLAPFQDLPGGGVDAGSGQVVIDDMWVDGPRGLTTGTDAPLRLTLTNESPTTADALVGVSSPVAARAVLLRDGRTVSSIPVPAATQVDLEWRTGVELEGLRRDLRAGQWFPVTLTFSRSAPVTTLVAAGPLAAPPSTHAQPRNTVVHTNRSIR